MATAPLNVGLHCEFHSGEDYETMNYTPSTAKAAGEVVIVGEILGITHLAIEADQLGTLATGLGTYWFIGDAAIAAGDPVYWDASEGKASATATGNKYLGLAVTACTADDAKFLVQRGLSNAVPPGSGG